MDAPTRHRTLIVANLTASTPFLLQEVSRLAAERPTEFSLLVPNVDPATVAAELQQGAVQGVNNALADVGLPPPSVPAVPLLP